MENLHFRRALIEQEENLKDFISNYFESSTEEVENPWLKTTGVCELISCSPATVGRLRDEGLLKSSKRMGTYYYLTSDVLQMMEDGRIN